MFRFLATGIGSLPHKVPEEASRLVLQHLPEIPSWPQLPKRHFYEGMIPQFSQGLPGLVIDPANKRIHIDTNKALAGLEDFYNRFLQNDLSYFALTEEYAPGFHQMLRLIKESRTNRVEYVKGQVTGPITFGSALLDEQGRAIIHNPTLADAVVKILTMKGLWQVEQIKRLRFKSIIFIDEPSLMGYGSAYVPITRELVLKQLGEIIDALHKANALVGIHCCGNTDWGMLLEIGEPTQSAGIDILSFDAYGYLDKLALYPEDLNKFLQRGGTIAWGIVPAMALDKIPSTEGLLKQLKEGMERLVKKGVDRQALVNQAILTPSCGLGTLAENEAEQRLRLLRDISKVAH